MKQLFQLLLLFVLLFGIYQLSNTPYILVSDPSTWFNAPQYEQTSPIAKYVVRDHEDGFFLPYQDVTNKEFILHKAAHIIFFSLLTVSAYFNFKKKWVVSWLFVTVYALFDEIHQSFMIGRSGRALDVGLDSLASLFTLFLLYIFVKKETSVRTTSGSNVFD